MRRFTRDGRTWEIELAGNVFHVNDAGKRATRKFIGADHARAQHDKAIAAKLAEGWVEAEVRAPAAPRTDEAPLPIDDLDALAVRADELIERGDFRGELVSIQLEQQRLSGDPGAAAKRKKIAERVVDIVDENRAAIFGRLARVADATTPDGPAPLRRAALVVTFRLGVAAAAHLSAAASFSLSEIWAELARLPLFNTLRAVTCGSSIPARGEDAPRTYVPFLAALAKHGAPPRLREVVLGDVPDRYLGGIELGDLAVLDRAAPDLERLTLKGGSLRLGGAIRPALRELTLEGPCVGHATIGAIAAAPPPRLEALLFAAWNLDASREVFDLVERLPHLRRLAIRGFAQVSLDDLFARPFLARLTHLDLSRCNLTEQGGEHVLRLADKLAHMEALDLRQNGFSHDLVKRIRTRLPRANAFGQWDIAGDEDDRYDDIHE